MQVFLAILSGGLVGFTLGMLGGGGSILAVPLLLYVVGVHDTHLVIGSTALAVALTAYMNLIPHWRARHVAWKPAIGFALPGVAGAFLGSTVGKITPGKELLFLFAILMLVVAGLMLRQKRQSAGDEHTALQIRWGRVLGAGFIVGFLSGFFGIGGGFLIVPGLIFTTGMPMIMAIGSSLFAVGTLGLATAFNYALSGYIDVGVVLAYVGGGVVGGYVGAWVAGKLSRRRKTLQYIFAGVIAVVALYMMILNAHSLHIKW